MSVWQDVAAVFSRASGGAASAFASVVEALRTTFEGDAATRRQVAFSIAIIALSAKMAKADGIVTDDEVLAFQEVFEVPEAEFANVQKLYNLARRDVTGFDAYARQVRSLFPGDGPDDEAVLQDVLDALFHIAKADDLVHENELAFLQDVAETFGFDRLAFERVRARHVAGGTDDPFAVLGASPDQDYRELRRHYLRQVAENHPDRLIARGVPPEFMNVANDRTAALNDAWAAIEKLHGKAS